MKMKCVLEDEDNDEVRTNPYSSGVDGTWVKLIKAQIPFKTAGIIRHLQYTLFHNISELVNYQLLVQ